MELFPELEQSTLFFETMARRQGYQAVAGIDEAGRGPLAGPVVAAAVILPEHFELPGLNDSKQLSEKKRNELYPLIHEQAIAVGIGVSRADEVDQINIWVPDIPPWGAWIHRCARRWRISRVRSG